MTSFSSAQVRKPHSCFFKVANIFNAYLSSGAKLLKEGSFVDVGSGNTVTFLQSPSLPFPDMANQLPLSHSVWMQLQNPSPHSAPGCHFHRFWVAKWSWDLFVILALTGQRRNTKSNRLELIPLVSKGVKGSLPPLLLPRLQNPFSSQRELRRDF